MDSPLAPLLPAISEAGKTLVRFFGAATLASEEKGTENFVTEADHAANEIIVRAIRSHYPCAAIWSEEGPQEEGPERFVIDPLDGTHNFRLGKAEWAISIAYEQCGAVVAGAVVNPLSGQWFYANASEAWYWFQDQFPQPMAVAKRESARGAYVSYTPGYDIPEPHIDAVIGALKREPLCAARALNGWCPAFELGLLALGRLHACILEGPELHDWAAGMHIARVAGAVAAPLPNGARRAGGHFVLAGTEALARSLRSIF